MKENNIQFYKKALTLAVPMIIQALITNFVSMLDNIMVGSVGTAQMSGVSIANQYLFVFNITVFGGISGAGIFGTQFFGKGDKEGQKYTVRFRLIMVAVLILIGAAMFYFYGSSLIGFFINSEDTALASETLYYGDLYLKIMILSLIPFGIGQAYASVVRECGETKIPMQSSLAAIGVNLVLDYGLIFGKLGMPKLGVAGAAIATLVAKIIECLYVVIWAHMRPEKNPYIEGLYRGMYIPPELTKEIIKKGFPLLVNEFLWSIGMSVVAQCYSYRGLNVVAARNIASTLVNLFSVVYIQLGAAIGIIVGMELGASRFEEAKRSAKKLNVFSMVVSGIVGIVMAPVAYAFPQLYNTTEEIKQLATFIILIQAIALPLWAFTNSSYFILRSGGKTFITFLFDFVYTWAVMIPLAFVLSRYTTLEIHWLFAIVTYSEVLKVVVGFFMVRSGVWINNITT